MGLEVFEDLGGADEQVGAFSGPSDRRERIQVAFSAERERRGQGSGVLGALKRRRGVGVVYALRSPARGECEERERRYELA